jgi:hypothetical protein
LQARSTYLPEDIDRMRLEQDNSLSGDPPDDCLSSCLEDDDGGLIPIWTLFRRYS